MTMTGRSGGYRVVVVSGPVTEVDGAGTTVVLGAVVSGPAVVGVLELELVVPG